MVPFGDPREVDPFAIDCAEKGTGRWAGHQELGLRLSPRPASGRALQLHARRRDSPTSRERRSHAGQRLRVLDRRTGDRAQPPYEGQPHRRNQVFILGLDAPVKPETIVAHAHCVAAGVNEEIGVRLVTGSERKTILDNRKSFAASYLRLLLVDGEGGRTRGFTFRLPATGSDNDKFLRLRDAPGSPLVTVACARTLPAGAEVKLIWGKGIAATSGVPTSSAQALAFKVRPTFRASFTCDRVNKDAQCIPILPLTLSLTAPIAKADALKIRLVDAAGKNYPAKVAKSGEDDGITTVTFGPGCRSERNSGSSCLRALQTMRAACWPTRARFRSGCAPTRIHRWRSSPPISAFSSGCCPATKRRCCR
jgi:hypothetical protein